MPPTSKRPALAWWALFAFLCLLMVVIGLETALHFVGPAIDGPFQLYNSLRRIWVGQRGGVDFQFFHGLGIPYVHFLQFRLLGGTFIASEITRQLTSVVLYPLSVVVFLRFFLKDWTRVAAWSAIIMMATIGLRLTSLLIAVNSLLGVRSTLPIFVPIALCLPVRRAIRVTLTGVILGGALVMGSEQGLAAVFALIVATALLAWRSRDRMVYVVDTGAAIIVAIATLVIVLTAIGGVSGMRGALSYNFRLVPMDQYWYFGSPPNRFVDSWGALPRLFAYIPRIPVSILFGLAAAVLCIRQVWRTANTPAEREQFAFLVLVLYGVASCASLLGTWVLVYVQPLLRVLLLLAAVALDRRLSERTQPRVTRARFDPRSRLGIALATAAMMIFLVPSMLATTFGTLPHFVRAHLIDGKGPVYSGIWPETINGGQAILDAHRNPDGSPPTLWSTYAGLLEARNGLFHPSFDYIIHVLGPANRVRYVDTFRRVQPQLVQTVSPVYTQYEPWIEGTSWDFYAELLRNYRLVGSTPWSLFWERLPTPSEGPQEVWSADIPAGSSSVTLPAAPGADGVVLLQAELFYRVHNPLRALPVVGALPRYLVNVENAAQPVPTSLDPYVPSSRIPILAYRGKSVRLSWGTFSLLPGAGIEVTKVRLSFVPVSQANVPWLNQLYQRQMGAAPDQ